MSLSSAGISGVQISSLVVGIDETATETQLTEGWSFFLLASAFGDILEPIDYQAKCRVHGADLELLTDGTLNLTVSTGL